LTALHVIEIACVTPRAWHAKLSFAIAAIHHTENADRRLPFNTWH
jgi:hypothetical protein